MGLLSKLLGARVAPTSENIGAEIEAHKTALAQARGIVAAAAQARARALDDLDSAGMAKADEAAAAGGRAVEIEERALALLADAHKGAVEAEQAAARAAALAALVERRKAIGVQFETEWRDAAAVLAGLLGAARTLQRDCAEGGFEREVERLPEIARFDACADSASIISTWLGDALSAPPTVPESPAEAAAREHQARRDRERAAEAEARRARAEAEAEEGRAAREAERLAEAERGPYYGGGWRDHLSDAAR